MYLGEETCYLAQNSLNAIWPVEPTLNKSITPQNTEPVSLWNVIKFVFSDINNISDTFLY